MVNNEIRKRAQVLIYEYGDNREAYAAVCNHLNAVNPDVTMLGVKRYLEYLITCDMMDEHGWEQTDTGGWRKIENDEFWQRWENTITKE